LVEGRSTSWIVKTTDGRMIQAHNQPTPGGGWVTTHEDVTERRNAERQLREQKLQLDSALNNMNHGLLMFDAEARLVLCNQRYMQMYDLPPDAVRPGRSLRELLTLRKAKGMFARDPDEYVDQLQAAAVEGRPTNLRLIGFNHFVVAQLQARNCIYEALDTMGCATRNVHRRGRGWLVGEANRGFCNRIGWYDGLNVITSVTPDGVITGFGCAPASTKEQPYAETFLAARVNPPTALAEVGAPALGWYVADNGFCGRARHQVWSQVYGARVITPPQKTRTAHPWPKAWRRWLASVRQIVETVHAKLLITFRLERERPHQLQGFRARLAASVGLHNLCIWLNAQLGRPRLAFADLIEW
jgi:PAS domain-containing protein